MLEIWSRSVGQSDKAFLGSEWTKNRPSIIRPGGGGLSGNPGGNNRASANQREIQLRGETRTALPKASSSRQLSVNQNTERMKMWLSLVIYSVNTFRAHQVDVKISLDGMNIQCDHATKFSPFLLFPHICHTH